MAGFFIFMYLLSKLTTRVYLSFAVMLGMAAWLHAPAWASSYNADAVQKQIPEASLQARAHQEVAHDWLRITMQLQLSDASQPALSAELNQRLSEAMDKARAEAGTNIHVRSGRYQVWPVTDDTGSITNWRGKAELYLESSDFDAVSQLAAQLGSDAAIASLEFSVAPETRAQIENALLENAVDQFLERAGRLAKALGYTSYRLNQISLGGSGDHYAPVVRRSFDASVAMAQAVPVEGGTESISLTVQGSIYLFDLEK